MKIYLIRHGRQDSKLCNVDVGLSEEGKRQAALLGERLAGAGIERVYSSGLLRAYETAQIANECWKQEHIVIPELREISFGELEGKSDEEIAVVYADFKKKQEALTEDLPYPGGECAADVIRRTMPVLMEITECGCKNVAVVTHGCVIRSLITAVLGMKPEDYRRMGNSLENGSISCLVWHEGKKRFTLERFNDYAHLEAYPELLRASWVEAEN